MPGSVDRGHPAPLVVVLHGGFGVGAGAVQQGHWDATAEARGFVTVAPDGIGKTWNAGICCGQAAKRQLDDVGFVVALVDEIARRRPIDRTRVYATGISNGGLLAYRLGCEASDDFAAVGPVAATLPVTCDPSQPVSVIHVHGLADRNVPFTGGVGSKGVTRTNWPAVEPGIDRWVAIDGCDPRTATSTTQGRVTTATWPACRAGTAVELVTISDGGHSWPGGQRMSAILDPPSDALDGTDTIWAFFAAHPKR